ncbi:MAG: ribosome biogenesis factor YjgA [Steroidobacteraceae bacterium]
MTTDDDDWQDLPPSKSSRKRDAHALQKMGEELVRLRAAELDQLPLPETLRDAIDEARRLTSRGALSRQHQYIGKLMRDIDIEPIREALAHLTEDRNARARLRK